MKVVGTKRSDSLKDYTVSHNGAEFVVEREGSSFTCEGVTGTLKEIKEKISDGTIAAASDDDWDDSVVYEPVDGIWSCIHPCALLVRQAAYNAEVLDTLDKWGWLDDDGNPDVARAAREFAAVSRLQEISNASC